MCRRNPKLNVQDGVSRKLMRDNLRIDRQFWSNISSAFTPLWVPPQLDDPGFRGAYVRHNFVFKDTKAHDLSRGVIKTHEGVQLTMQVTSRGTTNAANVG